MPGTGIITFIIVLFVIFLIFKIFKLSLKLFFKLLLNAVIGAVILFIFNYVFAGLLNLAIFEILIFCLIAFVTGVLCVPGVIILFIIHLII